MKSRCLVQISDITISVVRSTGENASISIGRACSLSDKIDELCRLLDSVGASKDFLILAVESHDVFFVQADYDETILQDTDALRYALEEKLPVDAEFLVPAVLDSTKTPSAIAWNSKDQFGLIQQLGDDRGVFFDAMVPVALLTAKHLRDANPIEDQIALVRECGIDIFHFDGSTLESWNYLPGALRETDKLSGLVVGDKNASISGSSAIDPNARINEESQTEVLLSALSALPMNANQIDFDFSKATGISAKQAGSIWESVLLALLFFLICCTVTFGYLSFGNKETVRNIQKQMVADYQTLLPNKRLNGPVEKLLEDEAKIQSKKTALLSHTVASKRLLSNLKRFLAALPSSIRFELSSIELSEESVLLQGNVKGFDEFQELKQRFLEQGFRVRNDTPYSSPFTLRLDSPNYTTESNS